MPSVLDNYNQDTRHVDWGGVAKSAGESGALGVLIGSVPFAYGVLRGKLNRGLGDEPGAPIDQARLDQGLAAGHITPDGHAWFSSYLQSQANPKDTALAAKVEVARWSGWRSLDGQVSGGR